MKPRRPSARSRARNARPEVGPRVAASARVSLGPHGLRVDGREVPLWSGAMHYFRLERDAWRAALRELAAMGLRIVESYVPWQVHEVGPGNYDFGRVDPRKDLRAFVAMAAEMGLLVHLRPGPHINAEMTYFGLPERIVFDRACQARSPTQGPVVLGFPPRMFPVPSYASRTYLAEVRRWFQAFADEIRDLVFPSGPVVLLQVDNEAAYYFRDGPYEQDYHPDAVEKFRDWTIARHGTLDAAARAHRATYARREDLVPPTRFDVDDDVELAVDESLRSDLTFSKGPSAHLERLALHLDWAAFREELVRSALCEMRDMLREEGLGGVPMTHNLPLGELSSPTSLPELEGVLDVVGLDYYHARREHRVVKRRTLYLAGSSRLPFAPEMGVGAPPWFTPLSHEDSLYTAMVALAYGLRGMNLYMAVDRDRWYGAPVDAWGSPRLEAASWKRLIAALDEVEHHRLRRKADVAILLPREYLRLSRATHVLGPITPVTLEAIGMSPVEGSSESSFGLAGPIQVLWWKFVARFLDALGERGIPHVLLDGDVAQERLAAFRVLVVPSFEIASARRWSAIVRHAGEGGCVVYGPALPRFDETATEIVFETPPNALRVLVDRDEDARAAVDALLALHPEIALEWKVEPASLEITVHESEAGPRALFLINPTRAPLRARIAPPRSVDAPVALEDLWTSERFDGDAGDAGIEVPVAATSVRMFRVLRGGVQREGDEGARR